ncbi:hypothetical protein HCB17_06690 [Salinispora arenicola]|uniref:hypothetical protein n=1 Tax=Salinispora arenicola TaxID=168697 RepID=UPI0016BCA517|nr:hypothetical protein [Salinispora arenicola]NIL40893.1 hypothetical protein [Salinispora arenicola]
MVHRGLGVLPRHGRATNHPEADRVVFLGYQAGGSNHSELNPHHTHRDMNTKDMPERDIKVVDTRDPVPRPEEPR